MKEVYQLVSLLRPHLKWNKARIVFLAQFILALSKVRSVNLMRVASGFCGSATSASSYKRILRFLRHFELPLEEGARLLAGIIDCQPPWVLSLDRTNWKLGQKHINLLVLSIGWHNMAVPLFWRHLDKAGNSYTAQRIELLERYLSVFPKSSIKVLLADREFRGAQWLKYLKEENIPFALRIPWNTKVLSRRGNSVSVANLFRIAKGRYSALSSPRYIWGHSVYLSCFRSQKGLIIIACDTSTRDGVQVYRQRWQIECLFQALKGRGFNLEETHITRSERFDRLLYLVSLTLCWCYQVGHERHRVKPIKVKNHGRPSQSVFRLGLDIVSTWALNSNGDDQTWGDILTPFRRLRRHGLGDSR